MTFEELLTRIVRDNVREIVREELQALREPSPTAVLTKSELAGYLGCSVATIDRWIAEGRLPYIQAGGRKKFHMIAVRKALGMEK